MAKKSTYTTEDRVELTLKRINPAFIEAALAKVDAEFEGRGEPVQPPTRRLELATGETEEIPLDADSLDGPEEAARWKAHERALARLNEARAERQHKLLFQLCVQYDPEDEACKTLYAEWEHECAVSGFDIPDDPAERRWAFLWYKLLSPYDVALLRSELEVLNYGRILTREELELFRGRVQSAMGQAGRAALERTEREIGKVVARLAAPADEGGEGLGAEAEPVGPEQ